MFDIEAIEDLGHDIRTADQKLRKDLSLPLDTDNPAEIASKLAGLAHIAASAAQAINIVMSHKRNRELLEAQLRSEAK